MNLLLKKLSCSTLHNLVHFSLYLTLFIIFWQKTRNPKVSSTPGRKLILTGGLLLTTGSIFEVLESIATSTNHLEYVGLLEFSQEAFGYIAGSILVLIGIGKWLPSIIHGQEMKTRLEKSNEALKKLWQRHKLAMSAGPAWCWEINLKTLEFYWDTQIHTTLGYRKEDFSTVDNYLSLINYPEKEEIYSIIQEVAEGKKVEYKGERLYKSRDGKNIWVKVKAKAFPDNKGRPERLVGIAFDITDIVEMRNRLEEESTVNKVMAQLAEEIISTNSISKISELSLEAALYFTQSPYGFAGYVDPETKNLISPSFSKDVWHKCQIPGKKLVFTKCSGLNAWVRKKGQSILTNTPVQDIGSSGTPTGHVTIKRILSVPAIKNNTVIGQIAVANAPNDYNDKHRAVVQQIANLYALGIERISKQNELQNALIAAQSAAKAKHNFIISISHELRTPLNAILGFGQLLKSQISQLPPDKKVEYISLILKAGANLSSMIEDILTIASAEDERSSYNMELCTGKELIDEFKEMADSMVREKGLHLETEIDPDIADLHITAVPFMLKIAVRHLLDNAVKFTPDGGTIFFSALLNTNWLNISVKDTGIGIDPKDQDRIFEDFVQLKMGMRDKTPGLGLGLGLVRRIAKIHGGEIKVQSKGEGKGSEFILMLPINKVDKNEKNKNYLPD